MIGKQDERRDDLRSVLGFLTWVDSRPSSGGGDTGTEAGSPGRDDRFPLDVSAEMFRGQRDGGTEHLQGQAQAGAGDQDTRFVISHPGALPQAPRT